MLISQLLRYFVMWTQISLAVVEMIISVPEVHALYKLKPKSHKQTGELNATKV